MKFFFDFLPVLLFFLAYKSHDIYVATVVAVIAAAAQAAYQWLRHRRVARMQWVVLALLLVLGGATLWLRDPLFIKWKPTLVNWAFAAAFALSEVLRGPNLLKRLLGEQLSLAAPIWRRLNLGWIGFFLLSGSLNLYVAYQFDEATWVNFKLFGLLGLTLAFVLAQGAWLARHLPREPGGKG
ncbi:septation protein A [Alkalilimnicola sp. S0819]|uniref:septation protein A n=1 Tax=Alkalilimnicola sp. S0819 TaxID=2613922 RepID=UPI001261BD28|nr:septation protein A [Alkalilimnicola sp. S0819]KAB7619628.1 septation protein A [Alkalilimnicola sp. S0819]MPQ17565.1 septation protein A [Alkalilimnicola sp. S0819]